MHDTSNDVFGTVHNKFVWNTRVVRETHPTRRCKKVCRHYKTNEN